MSKPNDYFMGPAIPDHTGFTGFRLTGVIGARQQRRQEERDLRSASKKARATNGLITARGFGATAAPEAAR